MKNQELENRLLKNPETYKSLLGEAYGRNTATVILKRKILKNIKKGIKFGSTRLNGTRGGEVLFYHLDKKYTIIISMEYMDFNYFYCENHKKIDNVTIRLYNCYRLKNDKWRKIKDEYDIFVGNVIKVI